MSDHKKYREMKDDLGLTNASIADITGLKTNSVKSMTQPNKELPSWAKAMIFVWEKLKGKV